MNIYDKIQEDNKELAYQETFGHLAPEKNKKYFGSIIFTKTCYGHYETIQSNFNTLSSSPWYYDCENQFICDMAGERGEIYKFMGYFKNYKFYGKIKKIKL